MRNPWNHSGRLWSRSRKPTRARDKTYNRIRWRTYRNYLKSDLWQEKRQARLTLAHWKCEDHADMGEDVEAADVHHIKYPEKWGNEPVEDLRALCRDCHRARHRPSRIEKIFRGVLVTISKDTFGGYTLEYGDVVEPCFETLEEVELFLAQSIPEPVATENKDSEGSDFLMILIIVLFILGLALCLWAFE